MPIIYGSAGIKLGAGCLLCAYDDTATECLRPPIVVMSQLLGVHYDFAELTLFKARVKEWQADIDSGKF